MASSGPPQKEFRSSNPRNSHTKPYRKHPQQPKRVIPTHFLAVPLNTNTAFLSRISAFQDRLLKTRRSGESGTGARGLDPSIIIDPRRFHLTLGVMALEDKLEEEVIVKDVADKEGGHERNPTGTRSVESGFGATIGTTVNISSLTHSMSSNPSASIMVSSVTTSITAPTSLAAASVTQTQTHAIASTDSQSSPAKPITEARTVRSALELLRSLKPQLDLILGVPVLTTESNSTTEPAAAPAESISGTTTEDIPPTDRNTATIYSSKQNRHRSVLTVVLDKMNIMQSVAPPKPKAKGKKKLTQTVDEPTIPSSLSSVIVESNPVDITMTGDPLLNKEVHEFVNSVPTPVDGPARADLSALNPGHSSANIQHTPEIQAVGNPDIWANVMYLAPEENDEQGRKLRRVCDFIHITFKRAGYLTDTRPLKLHCTVINTSKRKPSKLRGSPFCYSDVLALGDVELLKNGSWPSLESGEGREGLVVDEQGIRGLDQQDATMLLDMGLNTNPSVGVERSTTTNTRRQTPVAPVYIDLGADVTVDVEEIGLWIMGSRGPNNEYVNCGGVRLG